jgi:hypothetical protein
VRRALASLLLVVSVAACSADQEPEIAPPSGDGPVTTSRALEPCPPGGPDEATPPAGCLDEDGVVQRAG